MPEGPEIKISADKIAGAIEGHPLKSVQIEWPALKAWQKELSQCSVLSVKPRSKAMLITFDNQMTLYSHNQLYGVWYVRRNGVEPKTNRSLRLALQGPEKTAWLYSATDIYLLDPDELAQQPYLNKLGPDVLDDTVTVEDILAQYTDKRFQRRRLTTLLLDQGFLAGLGNYLRSEILYVAGVPIDYRPADCSPEQLQKLAQASLDLPRQSYETGGVTYFLEDAMALKASGKPRSAYRFHVFARAGNPCRTCGTKVIKTMASNRRIYYCPRCQSA